MAPSDIRVGAVFRDVEGDVPLAECFADADNTCPLVSACRLRLALADAAQAFYTHLDEITLDALLCDNHEMLALLRPVACVR